MAQDTNFYVLLIPTMGGALMTVKGALDWAVVDKTLDDELYRDIFESTTLDYADVPADGDPSPYTSMFARVSDEKEHEPPRQATRVVPYYVFSNTANDVLAEFPVAYVAAITNDPTVR